MKKRPFLLLEILLAFSLVTICVIPLVKQPLKLYREELKSLEKMELERLADWTFTEVKEMLLKNEIPWEKIPELWAKTAPFPLPDSKIEIPGSKPKVIQRNFILSARGSKTGLKGESYRQIWVCINLNDQKYWFRVPVQKLNT